MQPISLAITEIFTSLVYSSDYLDVAYDSLAELWNCVPRATIIV